MSSVRLSLEFAGVILPVAKDEQGRDVVPLKPVAEVFGLDWETQRKKTAEQSLAKRLGTCTGEFPGADQRRKMVAIRLDRVSAYLNTLNPKQVRAAGNVSGADFLEKKQEEWDDLIHEYEMAGGIFAGREQREAVQRDRKLRTLLALNKEKRATSDEQDRKVLAKLQRGLAAELGAAYQADFVDGE
ncbi:MAG: phage antirepressor N-terminal domain-containing protein [Pseudomonadota bacterium]